MDLKQKHMLKADIGTLHFETKEWISETDFYAEELHFLKQLIQEKICDNTTQGQGHKEIFKHIDTMLAELSDAFRSLLAKHEKQLFAAQNEQHSEDMGYIISEHKVMTLKMGSLKAGVVQLKKSVFEYISENPVGNITNPINENRGE